LRLRIEAMTQLDLFGLVRHAINDPIKYAPLDIETRPGTTALVLATCGIRRPELAYENSSL